MLNILLLLYCHCLCCSISTPRPTLFFEGGGYRVFLLMVHDKSGLPKPLPFLRAVGMETVEVGRFSVWWRVEVGQGPPSSWGTLSSSRAPAGAEGPGTLLLGGRVDHGVHHPVAVAEFIVVPGNELDKVVVEGNASPIIEGRRVECRCWSHRRQPGPQCSLECPWEGPLTPTSPPSWSRHTWQVSPDGRSDPQRTRWGWGRGRPCQWSSCWAQGWPCPRPWQGQ